MRSCSKEEGHTVIQRMLKLHQDIALLLSVGVFSSDPTGLLIHHFDAVLVHPASGPSFWGEGFGQRWWCQHLHRFATGRASSTDAKNIHVKRSLLLVTAVLLIFPTTYYFLTCKLLSWSDTFEDDAIHFRHSCLSFFILYIIIVLYYAPMPCTFKIIYFA